MYCPPEDPYEEFLYKLKRHHEEVVAFKVG